MIKELIVVEGKCDTVAIKRAVEADTIETGGSALSEEVFKRIALAQARRGVIIFTDPDFAGERIRKKIVERIPGCKHAFIKEIDATYKKDIGIENASKEAIQRSLQEVKTEYNDNSISQIDWEDLLQADLIVHPHAAKRRKLMGDILGIGYCNGKQFFKRCNTFKISRQEFFSALEQIEKVRL